MRRLGLIILLAVSLGVGSVSWAMAPDGESLQMFFALGKERIVRNKIPLAKQGAVRAGLSSAVEKALYDALPQAAISVNFDTITEVLSENPQTFIDGYRVVAERRFGNYYHVGVEASVAMDRLAERLTAAGLVLEGTDKPKLLFLVSEQLPGSSRFDSWWAPGMSYIATFSDDAMSDALLQRGFQVLSHRAIMEEGVVTSATGLIRSEDALRIGASFGADVVVVGRAWTEPSGNVMGDERSFRGAVELEGLLVSSGASLGKARKVAVAVGTEEAQVSAEALVVAAREAASDLSVLVVDAMKEKRDQTTMIEVVVEGANFFENFTSFSREVEALDGVISLRPRERRMERAVMVVNFTGEGKRLAETLLAQTFKGFSITISEVSRDHIKVDMVTGGRNTFMQ